MSETTPTIEPVPNRPAGNATTAAAADGELREGPPLRIAYLVSRFPKITETFILYEMQAVESLGAEVALYPLWREPAPVMHAEAREYVRRARFVRLLSPRVLADNAAMLLSRPRAYLGALAGGVRANWGSRRFLLGFLAAFPKAAVFARDMQRRGVQHVHAHFASHPAAVAWVIHRLVGLPYSFTAHGSDLHRDQHMLREKVREAALVVAISEYNRRLILDHCSGEGGAGAPGEVPPGASQSAKVRVIHCGTDTMRFRPARRGCGSEGADRALQIACVGTLHEVKGQVHLIRACGRLRERGVPFRLHLVGDGPDEAMLRGEAARHGLAERVVFHGRRTREQIIAMLSETDVVVAPSVPSRDGRREGIPVALMEAMSSGVAVVASSLSGIPELVRHRQNGLLVPPGDCEALWACLEELAGDRRWRERLAEAARETVVEEFDQRRCAARLTAAIAALQPPQLAAVPQRGAQAVREVQP